jgi:sRNA-binding carbon storage regulator CsrA
MGLILTRKNGQAVFIVTESGETVKITILNMVTKYGHRKTRLAFDASDETRIYREEIYNQANPADAPLEAQVTNRSLQNGDK